MGRHGQKRGTLLSHSVWCWLKCQEKRKIYLVWMKLITIQVNLRADGCVERKISIRLKSLRRSVRAFNAVGPAWLSPPSLSRKRLDIQLKSPPMIVGTPP